MPSFRIVTTATILSNDAGVSSALEDLVASMTISELAQRSGRSVGAIAAYALGRSRPITAAPTSSRNERRSSSTTRKAARASVGHVDTRSASGRKEFDTRVLEAVRALGGSAQANDVERVVGGTPMQRRTSLARLVKSRKLTRSGQARATTYSVR